MSAPEPSPPSSSLILYQTEEDGQGRAAAVNQALVIRNWMVGGWIVEFEQTGKERAKYGTRLLESLARNLAERNMKGLGEPRVLRDCRVHYQTYPQIRGTLTRELPPWIHTACVLTMIGGL